MSIGFDDILGQEVALETLRRALRGGRVHHAYRFEGPAGVGKELAAQALAAALLCPNSAPEACGTCSACKRVFTISDVAPHVPQHPDLILVGRGIYSGTLITSKEAAGISVEQIRRVVLGRARFTPHEAARMVFIIRGADELTVASANALLKTLEEPRPQVHFILLTHRPDRLLDTVRSRTLAIRFRPLSEDHIAELLKRAGHDPASAVLANGSAELALRFADPALQQEQDDFARGLSDAIAHRDSSRALEFAGKLPKDRDVLEDRLLGYAQQLAIRARKDVETQPDDAQLAAMRYTHVLNAVGHLERNASPVLVVEALLSELRKTRVAL